MNFLVFEGLKSMKEFFGKIKPKKIGEIEYSFFNQFKKNRVLFTAEHAGTITLEASEFGENTHIGVGDRNTGKLAKIMAYRLKSGYLIFNYPRTEVDASRSFETLGGDEKLLVAVTRNKELLGKKCIKIHQNKKYLPQLEEYHSIIEKLNPKIIVSVHGIQRRHNNDVVFGFGKDSRLIGGVGMEKRFVRILNRNIKEKIDGDLKFRVSKKYYTGEQNYVLHRNVMEFNKNSSEKRYGMQIEFNRRSREGFRLKEFIKKKYQIVSQIIADSILEWSKGLD